MFLEVSYITNVSSVRKYIRTTMGYLTQFSMGKLSGKLKKKGLEYHNSFFIMKSILIGLV